VFAWRQNDDVCLGGRAVDGREADSHGHLIPQVNTVQMTRDGVSSSEDGVTNMERRNS
jgi:hypothetical protein